ncbi:MAG: hypothetical protein K0M45_07755 [Candidatus Paracaedibacteraceae bacterium]|nr:hypothetical protein [Candidatus Paracaedibacteraceae bacterium]
MSMSMKKRGLVLSMGIFLSFINSSSAISPCSSFCTTPKACKTSIVTKHCLTNCKNTLNFDLYCKLKNKGVKKATAKKISIYTDMDGPQNSEDVIKFLSEIDDLHTAINGAHLNEFFGKFASKQNPLGSIKEHLEKSKEITLNYLTQLPNSSQSAEPDKSHRKTIRDSFAFKRQSTSLNQSEYKIRN